VLNLCFQKFVNDTFPNEVMQKYAVAGNLGISGGIGIAQFIAVMICPTE
jgi:hypothetical protein